MKPKNPWATGLRSLKTVSACVWHTARTSYNVLYSFASGTISRPLIDDLTRRWAFDLINEGEVVFEVHNSEVLESLPLARPIVFMSNHASMLDIPLAIAAFKGPIRMLAKKEMLYYPLLGQAMKASEFLFVNRKNTKAAIEDLRVAKEKMTSGIRLWIYPEGTRSKDGNLLPFKKGGFHLAFQTQAIIVPVAIVGARDVLAKDSIIIHPGKKVDLYVGRSMDTLNFQGSDAINQVKAETESAIRSMLEHRNHSESVVDEVFRKV